MNSEKNKAGKKGLQLLGRAKTPAKGGGGSAADDKAKTDEALKRAALIVGLKVKFDPAVPRAGGRRKVCGAVIAWNRARGRRRRVSFAT